MSDAIEKIVQSQLDEYHGNPEMTESEMLRAFAGKVLEEAAKLADEITQKLDRAGDGDWAIGSTRVASRLRALKGE